MPQAIISIELYDETMQCEDTLIDVEKVLAYYRFITYGEQLRTVIDMTTSLIISNAIRVCGRDSERPSMPFSNTVSSR